MKIHGKASMQLAVFSHKNSFIFTPSFSADVGPAHRAHHPPVATQLVVPSDLAEDPKTLVCYNCQEQVWVFLLTGPCQGPQPIHEIAGVQSTSAEFASWVLAQLGSAVQFWRIVATWNACCWEKIVFAHALLPWCWLFSWLLFLTKGLRPPANPMLKGTRHRDNFQKIPFASTFICPPGTGAVKKIGSAKIVHTRRVPGSHVGRFPNFYSLTILTLSWSSNWTRIRARALKNIFEEIGEKRGGDKNFERRHMQNNYRVKWSFFFYQHYTFPLSCFQILQFLFLKLNIKYSTYHHENFLPFWLGNWKYSF